MTKCRPTTSNIKNTNNIKEAAVWDKWGRWLIYVFLYSIRVRNHHHNRYMALFLGPPRWAGARRELLDFMAQGKINRGRHTDHPSGRHSIQTNQCPPPPSPYVLVTQSQIIVLHVQATVESGHNVWGYSIVRRWMMVVEMHAYVSMCMYVHA